MQSTSLLQKKVKIIKGYKIAKSILKIVKRLKKTCKKNTNSIFLNNIIKFFMNRYGSNKNLLFNSLNLMKNNHNMGIFFTLDGNN